MGVDVTHLVFEPLGDADNHVRHDRFDSTERRNILSVSMVEGDIDYGFAWALREGEVDMLEVSSELAARTSDFYDAGFDIDDNCARREYQYCLLVSFPFMKLGFQR